MPRRLRLKEVTPAELKESIDKLLARKSELERSVGVVSRLVDAEAKAKVLRAEAKRLQDENKFIVVHLEELRADFKLNLERERTEMLASLEEKRQSVTDLAKAEQAKLVKREEDLRAEEKKVEIAKSELADREIKVDQRSTEISERLGTVAIREGNLASARAALDADKAEWQRRQEEDKRASDLRLGKIKQQEVVAEDQRRRLELANREIAEEQLVMESNRRQIDAKKVEAEQRIAEAQRIAGEIKTEQAKLKAERESVQSQWVAIETKRGEVLQWENRLRMVENDQKTRESQIIRRQTMVDAQERNVGATREAAKKDFEAASKMRTESQQALEEAKRIQNAQGLQVPKRAGVGPSFGRPS
jgi:hypothetical protein